MLQNYHPQFVPTLGIPTDGTEPLLFQGDLNIDEVLFPEQVDKSLSTLNAALPDTRVGDQLFSSDPGTNFLVGKDGGAEQCFDTYQKNLTRDPWNKTKSLCEGEGLPTKPAADMPLAERYKTALGAAPQAFCPCCHHELLDYILYSTEKGYLQPLADSTFRVVPLKATKQLSYKWNFCSGGLISGYCYGHVPAWMGTFGATVVRSKMRGDDLSDHYPVVADFVFKPIKKEFPVLDGCKSDADCTLNWFQCYCTGPGCTRNGEHLSGWEAGKADKVNDNCQGASGISLAGSCFCRLSGH